MRIAGNTHLSYCTNIHPGESLAQVQSALASHVLRVKALVAPTQAFGLGLRLSNAASEELMRGDALPTLRAWLDAHGLYVFTINGFPYGAFHGTRVKETVYEPDWRSRARVAYSDRLADALAQLLPDDAAGSISSVPGAFKAALTQPDDSARMAEHMLQHAAHLFALREKTGRTLALALEPEPSCFLETTEECVRFFGEALFSRRAIARMVQLTGLSKSAADAALHLHLGVCIDTCHAAVEFEEAATLFDRLAQAGIDVKKLQLSAGLRLPRLDPARLSALREFAEDVYLHQTVEREGAQLRRFTDLPDALSALPAAAAGSELEREWRIHFHVPLFMERYGALESTQAFLREVLERQRVRAISPHLEVETYTWDVLPLALRSGDVAQAIARELDFVTSALSGTLPP